MRDITDFLEDRLHRSVEHLLNMRFWVCKAIPPVLDETVDLVKVSALNRMKMGDDILFSRREVKDAGRSHGAVNPGMNGGFDVYPEGVIVGKGGRVRVYSRLGV